MGRWQSSTVNDHDVYFQLLATDAEGGRDQTPAAQFDEACRTWSQHGSELGDLVEIGGDTIVQTALVLNIWLMFLLGLFDFSRVIMLRQLVTNAAREGCRYAVVNTSTANDGPGAELRYHLPLRSADYRAYDQRL